MTTVYFENEKLTERYESNVIHQFELNKWLVIPNVGDIVDFDDDGFYDEEYRTTIGTKFIATAKEIIYSRDKECRDDCYVCITIEPYNAN